MECMYVQLKPFHSESEPPEYGESILADGDEAPTERV